MNKFCKIVLFLTVFTVIGSLVSISAASAANVYDDVTVIDSVDDEIRLESVDAVSVEDARVESVDEINPKDVRQDSVDSITVPESRKTSKNMAGASAATFTDLNNLISNPSNIAITLNNDYIYDRNKDGAFENGILIDHALTIDGNGHSIDGNFGARAFNISKNYITVEFKNINFSNFRVRDGNGGAAILGKCTARDCTFKNYDVGVQASGGAMSGGTAINCIFDNREFEGSYYSADKGGALYGGTAKNCTFIGNVASQGGAVYNCTVEGCTFENNTSKNWAGAMMHGRAKNCTFIRNSAPMSSGAASYIRAENCVFIENSAGVGGALTDSDAIRCVFIDNVATNWGGSAMQWCNSTLCTFNNDTFGDTKILA